MKPSDLPSGQADGLDFVARARALMPRLDAAGPRIDAEKAVPPELLDALFEGRLFRMLLPRSLGGAELDLPTFFEVIQIIAQGDASVAWSVAQSNGCAMSSAYLDPAVARDMFGHDRAVLSWGFPQGPCRMTPVEGGWRVTGTWGFGSGSRHSTWLGAHCQVTDAAGTPLKRADGGPLERTALIPRGKVTIVDSAWNVMGLRGTGSDTYALKDFFVPASHTVVPRGVASDLQAPEGVTPEPDAERREPGTLYRFSPTIVYQCGFAGVALGVARALLDSFEALARRKAPSGTGVLLCDSTLIQHRVAVSEARLASCRAWLSQCLRDSWDGCVATGAHRYEHRIAMRHASTYSIREAAQVAEDAYADAGATAIFESHPFERRFRDMHAITQQIQGSQAHLATVGQHFMGLKPSVRFI